MARVNYGIVDWYTRSLGKGFDLEDNKFKAGKDRDESLELSSEEFFNKVMQTALDKAPPLSDKAALMKSLKNNTNFKNKSIDIIKDENIIISGANNIFNEHITERINNSKLVKPRKEELIKKVNEYDSEEDVDKDIQEGISVIESAKQDFKSAETVEQREAAADKIRQESPNAYNAIRGWETRRGPEAVDFVFSQLD